MPLAFYPPNLTSDWFERKKERMKETSNDIIAGNGREGFMFDLKNNEMFF